MKHIATGARRKQFDVLTATPDCQAAKMVLKPGAESDDRPRNEHRHSEQWLFVIAGSGVAVVKTRSGTTRRVRLTPNSLLLIAKGEPHQIRNTGRKDLTTLNFYVPPAYDSDGEPKRPRSRRGRTA